MESDLAAVARAQKLLLLQEHYADFTTFLIDGMHALGFKASDIQADISRWLVHGPEWLMVQAQRSQAKTTITALFCIWSIIMRPKVRILIVTRGNDLSMEVSTMIVRLILSMPQLECLRPDRMAGDRTSVEAFDVHHSLKGVDKSPTVSCVGVTGGMTGKRADILVADDIESLDNARTQERRELLLAVMREFTAIVQRGRIIYLGTPHTTDSVYNALPGMGFAIRIWPGRYPTAEQRSWYGDMLAPLIAQRLDADPSLAFGGGLLGDRGQPIDPLLVDEDQHRKKEMQSKAYYELQYMLSTRLADADRYPLKLANLIAMPMVGDLLPVTVHRGLSREQTHKLKVIDWSFEVAGVHTASAVMEKPDGTALYIDPAPGGANGDASGYAVVSHKNATLFARDWGGVPGGYEEAKMQRLAKIAVENKVDVVIIEKNMGYGAFTVVFTPILRTIEEEAGRTTQIGILEDYVTQQKERRICDTLEPIIGRGSLVLNLNRLVREEDSLQQYEPAKRKLYSLPYQMAKITRERGALKHDDALDALEGACRYFQTSLARQQADADQDSRNRELTTWFQNPLNHPNQQPTRRGNSALSRSKRR